jgi:phosphonate transport system substrate-binding protein
VAAVGLDAELKSAIQRVLLDMHQDPEGKRILDKLLIDRFEKPVDAWYQPVREMYSRIRTTDEKNSVKNMAPHT